MQAQISSNLVILAVTTGQQGSYDVVVTNAYGAVTSSVAVLTVAQTVSGVVFSNLHSFGTATNSMGVIVDGIVPEAALMLDTDGNLYGTTASGGFYGFGTVFGVTTAGAFSNLYSFGQNLQTNGNALDGSGPTCALVQDANGSLYGTTYEGGANDIGTVFKLTTNGNLTSLYSFGTTQDTNGNFLDGENPSAGLTLGPDGSPFLFGTAYGGGSQDAGTMFRVTASGSLVSLHSFGSIQDSYGDYLDGANPSASLVVGSDGNLYGTTSYGGTNDYGNVFRITTNGSITILYSFGAIIDKTGNPADGSSPLAPLIEGADRNFYGTTYSGGTNGNGFGTVFRITTNGNLTTLYSFGAIQDTNGQALDGANPQGGLVQSGDGELYGTTSAGGKNNSGTVFQISTNGTLLTLYRFSGGNDGSEPEAGLVLLGNTLYGTTASGGSQYLGVVFSLTLASSGAPPAPPPLSILRSGSNVILMWPGDASGFTLESTTNLSKLGLWAEASGTPAVMNGQFVVTNAITNIQTFYRLAQ